jgi:hypothetical protein
MSEIDFKRGDLISLSDLYWCWIKDAKRDQRCRPVILDHCKNKLGIFLNDSKISYIAECEIDGVIVHIKKSDIQKF